MRAALIQLASSDDPAANLAVTEGLVREAAAGGAELVATPECTNIVSGDRTRQQQVLTTEAADPTLARLRAVAAELGLWLLIGSLCLRTGEPDGRFANRSLLVGPDGGVRARYDKIHMFDVDLAGGERYRESSAFRPGTRAVVAEAAGARLGMTICYDMRFPQLYRDLARAGAEVLTVPAAFTVPTGRAHWHALLRARAIETGCFVLAPAQSGVHAATAGPERRTWGHSLAVSPWGEVLADAGEGVGVTLVEIDLAEVARVRAMIPSLGHGRSYDPPLPGMTAEVRDPLALALFSEIVTIEQMLRSRLGRALPRGMELSHFMVLDHLARSGNERTPGQLARTFCVTKGAMTNTVRKLDAAGYVHVRPDWDDARRKWVGLSPAGRAARDRAVQAIAPVFEELTAQVGAGRLQDVLPTLRAIRDAFGVEPAADGP